MTDTNNVPTHTTSQDDEMVAQLRSDMLLDALGRGREVPLEALTHVLAGWRDEVRTPESKEATDAYDFFCCASARNTPAKRSDPVGIALAVMLVVVMLGYSISIGLSLYSVNWALLVSALSGMLCAAMACIALMTTPRRR